MPSLAKTHINDLLLILHEDDPKAVLAAAGSLLRMNIHLDEARMALEALIASSGGVVKVKAIDLLAKVLDAIPEQKDEDSEISKEELELKIRGEYGC